MDSRLFKTRALPKKPLLLRDYLLDDMGSCSSNGFKSFPRRQCCSTVPFFQEFDLKNKQLKKSLNFNQHPAKFTFSAFQSVVTAVKRLPFTASKPPEMKRHRTSFLPRSFPKKILTSGFWKKSEKVEIQQWKSFRQLLKEDSNQPDGSDRWSGGHVTVASTVSSGNASSAVNLDMNSTDGTNSVAEEAKEVVRCREVGAANEDVSTESTTISDGSVSTNSSTNTKRKQWSSEEKEQFSPMSVLDCPFDEEDEVSSPFHRRLARMEGTKKKLMKKIHMFESLAKLEPVNLAKRFASKPDYDNEFSGSPPPHSAASIDDKSVSDTEEQQEGQVESEAEEKAWQLLHRMKAALPSYDDLKLKPDKLLLDFFRERVTKQCTNVEKQWGGPLLSHEGLLEEAEDWIKGRRPGGLAVEWEAEKTRQVYVRDMEKAGEWKTLDQEHKEVAINLEIEVFAALLDELLLDISI